MVFAIIAIIIEGVLFGYMSSKYGVDSQIAASIFVNDQEKALLEAQIAAGNYIKKYTVPTDKIWTTDAAIAYFSQRVIVTTDSKYWKYQGFFIDIWGYQPSAIFQFSSGSYRSFIDIWGYGPTKFDYAGPIKDYPNGTITLSDLRLALENEKPKIIVMVNASQEDYLIWNGIHNPYHSENGLCDFIEGHYHLATDREGQILASQGIEFWMLYDKPTI